MEGGYSLEGVSNDLLEQKKLTMKERFQSPKIKKVTIALKKTSRFLF